MNPRDTKTFLIGLRQALVSFEAKGAEEKRLAHHCVMAALAVPLRLRAADERTSRFTTRRDNAQTKERRLEENQVVFDFFVNACAAVESFYFSVYFFGAIVNRSAFPLHQRPRQIRPNDALDGYQTTARGGRFTEGLAALLNAQQYREITLLRQYLSHRLLPGYRSSPAAGRKSALHEEVPLDDWELGPDWLAGEKLTLDPGALSGYSEWLEKTLGDLADDLDAYAQSQGF